MLNYKNIDLKNVVLNQYFSNKEREKYEIVFYAFKNIEGFIAKKVDYIVKDQDCSNSSNKVNGILMDLLCVEEVIKKELSKLSKEFQSAISKFEESEKKNSFVNPVYLGR